GHKRQLRGLRFCHAEVEHFHHAIRREADIRRLEITMDDATLVRRIERLGNLTRDLDRLIDRQRALGEQPIGERAALDELEDERTQAVALFDAVDGGDPGMIQGGEDPGFTIEARQAFRVARERLWQDFQGDVAIETNVARPINLAHAAGADRLDDFVRTKTRTGNEGHIWPDYTDQDLVLGTGGSYRSMPGVAEARCGSSGGAVRPVRGRGPIQRPGALPGAAARDTFQ